MTVNFCTHNLCTRFFARENSTKTSEIRNIHTEKGGYLSAAMLFKLSVSQFTQRGNVGNKKYPPQRKRGYLSAKDAFKLGVFLIYG